MTGAQTPPLDRYAAEMLAARREELTRIWLERLSRRLGVRPRRVFPTEALLDHMPELLDWVAASLVRDRPRGADGSVERIRGLARLRREQGFDIQEVLREFQLLGSILFGAVRDALDRYPGRPEPADVLAVAGRLAGAVGELIIITAGTYREEALADERKQAQLVAGFGRTLSHELKNPLAAAKGAADLLADEAVAGDPEQRRRFIEMIQRNLERARQLVDDVRSLAMARAAPGAAEASFRPLPDVVREVLEEVSSAAEERGVRLEVDGPLPGREVDAGRTVLALMNLVWNAVKYSDPDKPDRWVRVRAREAEEAGVSIEVADNGLGIPTELQDRVFERFFRAHPGSAEGTGLGLAIAREAVEQANGSISFESEPGKGTTFRIVLPGRPS